MFTEIELALRKLHKELHIFVEYKLAKIIFYTNFQLLTFVSSTIMRTFSVGKI